MNKRFAIYLVVLVVAGCVAPAPIGVYRNGSAVLQLDAPSRAILRDGPVRAEGSFKALSTNEVRLHVKVEEAKLSIIGPESKTEWVPRSQEEEWYVRIDSERRTFRQFQDMAAMRTQATEEEIASGRVLTVEGFVRRPGVYPVRQDMTIADALELAGGHAYCKHCATFFPDDKHPTYSGPVLLKRGETEQKVSKSEWKTFLVQPGDTINVRHIWL